MERGARDVIKIQTAYEPTIHFPVGGGSGAMRIAIAGFRFIGTPYDDRPEFLTRLWRECGFPVVISGDRMWRERLDPEAARRCIRGGSCTGRSIARRSGGRRSI